ncbi:MAG: molybdopterin molybdotransferase MoeA [Chitinophagaceae bacterium]
MLPVEEGKKLIKDHTALLPPAILPLEQVLCRVLADDIYAANDIPAFEQSAMDGYAFNFAGWQQHQQLTIQGEMAAGAAKPFSIIPQQAARIFTGAPLPEGADTVVMQEKVTVEGNILHIHDEQLQQGLNVRAAGSEAKAGTLAIAKGNVLTPAAIGFVAGMGIKEVSIYPAPSVSIIVTGNELQTPGLPLQFGQVYESNSFSLKAVLQQMQISAVTVYHAADELHLLEQAIATALQHSEILLLTGGVSVGSYDYVATALQNCGVQKVFHKLQQKPGKPLFFGIKGTQPVFGLPGNPSSVLTCFYEYVYPCIRQMMGFNNITLPVLRLPLLHDYSKRTGLSHFLKGWYDEQGVTALQAQESYRMQSFATSNCLICLPAHQSDFVKGELVEVHVL